MGQLSVAFVLERCNLALKKHVAFTVAHVCTLYTPAHTAYVFKHITHAWLCDSYTYMICTHMCTLKSVNLSHRCIHTTHTYISTTGAHLYNTLAYTLCEHTTHSLHKCAEACTTCPHTITPTHIYTCVHTIDTHTCTHKYNTDV